MRAIAPQLSLTTTTKWQGKSGEVRVEKQAQSQADGAERSYQFTVTGYDPQGVSTQLASGTSDDATFIVPMS